MVNDMCAICLENLDPENTVNGIYNWPGCIHKYHTDCIVFWLRSDNSNGSDNCPLCRKSCEMSGSAFSANISVLRKFALKKDAPPLLKKMAKNVRESEKKLKEHNKEFTKFKKENSEIINKYFKMTDDKWKYRSRVYRNKKKLAGYPVIMIPSKLVIKI